MYKTPCFGTKWDSLVLRTDNLRLQEFFPKPSGTPMGKVPLQIVKEFEHQARQNLCTVNFVATFAKTASVCNSIMEKCQDSIESTGKRVKSQIQKGADPEKAARHGYEATCDYLDILNKRILIQQRALTCLSKALSHILQSELYTMGNSSLIRYEAEMTHLQPHLGDSTHQELRSSPFGPLLSSGLDWLRMEKSSSLKKAPLKTLSVLDRIKTSPYVVPTIRKEAPTHTPLWKTIHSKQ